MAVGALDAFLVALSSARHDIRRAEESVSSILLGLTLGACGPKDGSADTTDLPGATHVATDALWDPQAVPVFHLEFADPNWRDTLWGLVVEDDCLDRVYLQMSLVFDNPLTGESEQWDDVGNPVSRA